LKAGLYIVPTPIGNLEDMTLRALDVLRSANVIAAEDTRHSRRLLSHYDIGTPLVSFHEHSGVDVVAGLVERIIAGQVVALISDAGTPLVSDPGYELVQAVQAEDLPVSALPGACAAITALSAAGLPTHAFYFAGFMPAKSISRRKRLREFSDIEATLILYEAPHRIVALLEDARTIFGNEREAVLARELTKTYETVRRDQLSSLADWVASDPNQQKGEIVVLIAPHSKKTESPADPRALKLLEALSLELPPKRASQLVAQTYELNAKSLYQYLLDQKNDDQ
jgi:16S rRNA (cytidine1402-2'-O)-methyltransferase